MKKLFENWRNYTNETVLNEKKKKKPIKHDWSTHGHRRSDENKEIGEVINHSLTESGKIEFYEVKFGDKTEVLAAEDFVSTKEVEHEHQARELEEYSTTTGPGEGPVIGAGAAEGYIDESWPDSGKS